MYRHLYITIHYARIESQGVYRYINQLMYRLMYRYTAIQRDTSEMMYPHPSGKLSAEHSAADNKTMFPHSDRFLHGLRLIRQE